MRPMASFLIELVTPDFSQSSILIRSFKAEIVFLGGASKLSPALHEPTHLRKTTV